MIERRCFVISTFSDKDSPSPKDREAWKRANGVKENIIDVTMQRVSETLKKQGQGSIAARRGDRNPRTGAITAAIYDSIRGDEVLIAVLLRSNENVAYEIGLAHAMGRPVILLKHHDYSLGFDLAGDRYIPFSDAALDPNHPSHEEVVADLCAQVNDLLSPDGTPAFKSNPFDKHAAPFARCTPFDRMRVPTSKWSKTLLEAEREIWLAGHTLHRLFEQTNLSFSIPGRGMGNIRSILLPQLINGCDINILIMDQNSPSFERRLLPLGPSHPGSQRKLERLCTNVEESEELIWALIDDIPKTKTRLEVTEAPATKMPGTLRFTKVRFGQIANRVILTERRAYVTPIFHSFTYNSGPSFETYPKSKAETHSEDASENITLFSAVLEDLKQLQQHNPTVTVHSDGTIEGDRPPLNRSSPV